jgi:hypothetical protein
VAPIRVTSARKALTISCPTVCQSSRVQRASDRVNYKRINPPQMGPLDLEFTSFAVEGRPDLSLLVFNFFCGAHPRDVGAEGVNDKLPNRLPVLQGAAGLRLSGKAMTSPATAKAISALTTRRWARSIWSSPLLPWRATPWRCTNLPLSSPPARILTPEANREFCAGSPRRVRPFLAKP